MVITSPNIVSCKACGKLILKQTRNTRPNETGLCRSCWCLSKRGENSEWYKDGSYINQQGYKFIRLYPEDAYYDMADGKGYVREHRLVMAKHLRRSLHSWESVHHKDGDKLNNEIINLELLNKNQHMKDHNKGYGDGFEKGLIDGRKEALKKVVEWLLDNELHPERDGLELSGKSLLALLDEVKE